MALATTGKKVAGAITKYGGGTFIIKDGSTYYNLGYVKESTVSIKDNSGDPESIVDESGVQVASIPAEEKIVASFEGILMQASAAVYDNLLALKGKEVEIMYQSTKKNGILKEDGLTMATQFIFMPRATLKLNYENKTGNKMPPFKFDLAQASTTIAKDSPMKWLEPVPDTGGALPSGESWTALADPVQVTALSVAAGAFIDIVEFVVA